MFKKPLITIIKKLLIPYRQTRFLKDMTVNIDYVVVILTGIEILAQNKLEKIKTSLSLQLQ